MPETAASYLIPKIKNFKGGGNYPQYLTKPKAMLRFMTAFNKKGRFFDNEGNLLVDLDS